MATTTANLMTRYLDAQLAGDRNEALRIILAKGPEAGVAPDALYLDVVGAAQRELGRLWQEGRITVADEHQASAISQFVLAHLYAHLDRAPGNGKLVAVACVDGDLHEMGARMASDFLEAAGFDVRYLGADVPTSTLIAHCTRHRPVLVALSATMVAHFAALQRAIRRLRQDAGRELAIVAGGFVDGAAPDLPPHLGVITSSGTARDLVAVVRRLSGAPS
jgi:MerR family transcriptional regulator, light-induced transcriptional regulator